MRESATSEDEGLALARKLLNEPLEWEMPPPEIYRVDAMLGGEPNPKFEEWKARFFHRLSALYVVKGIEPTKSGGIDWRALALRLIFDYEPRDKREPRIRFRRKRGAKPKHEMPSASAARRKLVEIVARKLAANPRMSVVAIAKSLAGKDELPPIYRRNKWETLRKHIERAESEAAKERSFQKVLSELFKGDGLLSSYRPGKDFLDNLPGWSGSGLNLRPTPRPKKPG